MIEEIMVNPCKLCAATCCRNHLITVMSFDVLRIMEKTGKNPEEFTQLSPPKILNLDNDTVLECYEGRYRYDYLLTLKSRPCYFLGKDNYCSIYEAAPWVCKLYPHRSDDGFVTPRAQCTSLAKLIFMIKTPGMDIKKYQKQMQTYKKIIRSWNKLHGKKEDCLSYLLKESKNERFSEQ